jgi:hypothetical protein
MNLNQATQMLTWLDEERRRDKTELAKLQQRVESQAAEITEQARRIQELEGRLASTQAKLTQFPKLEQALDQLRDELVLLIGRHDEQRRTAEMDAERVRQVERDSQARVLGEIRKELQRLPRHEEEIQLRRAEDQRLGEGLLDLQQQMADLSRDLDNRTRNLPYLEEQPRRNAKRIAELQQETPELFKRNEAQSTKLQLLEELVRRSEHRVGELDLQVTESKQEQKDFIEAVKLAEQQRERQMNEWAELMDEQHQKMEEYGAQMQQAAEQYKRSEQALAALEKLEERLKRDQAEVAELQRLAEKRQKHQLDEWQAEDEKRWKKHTIIWEQHWHNQDRWNEEQATRLGSLEESTEANLAQITALWQTWQEYARRQISEMQERIVHAEEKAKKLR